MSSRSLLVKCSQIVTRENGLESLEQTNPLWLRNTRREFAKLAALALDVVGRHLTTGLRQGNPLDASVPLVFTAIDQTHVHELIDVPPRSCHREPKLVGNLVDRDRRITLCKYEQHTHL